MCIRDRGSRWLLFARTWDVATELKHLENGDYLATIIVDEEFLSRPETVSYTHLDVYKRQE